MLKHNKVIVYVFSFFIFCTLFYGLLKYVNLSWVETQTNGTAKITLNFLVPMNVERFNEHIHLIGTCDGQTSFQFKVKWLNTHVAEIYLEEDNEIKGQQAKLWIDRAPTKWDWLVKSGEISIQFKTDIQILSPIQPLLIASTHPIVIAFNTPIAMEQVKKYFMCDADFEITAYQTKDDTKYLFTPKAPLENGKVYALIFESGMRSKSGMLLKEKQVVQIKIDQKPTISTTYPLDENEWIGLYPRLLLTSKEPIVAAYIQFENEIIKGELLDSTHAYFILKNILKPETKYLVRFQTQVQSGEVSEIKKIHFTTTTIKNNRFWLDIRCGKLKQILCYEGQNCIKTIPFETGIKCDKSIMGTYYLQEKSEVYEDNKRKLGGNYWMMLSEQLGIQGILREANWQPSDRIIEAKNFVVNDAEAAWLYEKLKQDTMIIVRE